MPVKHSGDARPSPVTAGEKTTISVLISSQEAPNFAMRRFNIAPGGGMPLHTNTVEHEQYVLKGHARIGIGAETFEVTQGDVVFIPRGSPHWYKNIGGEDFEFLCLVPNEPDKIELLPEKEC